VGGCRVIRRIGILGAGALGTLLTAVLSRSHTAVAVWLLARSPRPARVRVEGEDGWEATVRVITEPSEPLDLLVVLVKSFATRDALQWARGAIGPETLLLTLQNGVGNAEVLAEVAGPERVLAGTTAIGARLLAPGRVQVGGIGETAIAPWVGVADGTVPAQRALADVVGLFQQAGLPCRAAPAAAPLLWAKLAVNAAINPLTAILRVPNGELLRRPEARAMLEEAAAEVGAVAAAAGIQLGVDPVLRALQVAEQTAANRSSMLQDVEAGRPTEIEAITGAVVERAERFGVPVPINRRLLGFVRSMEAGRRARG
jgi:2-dehydropantoate 2-reductase